MHPVQPCVPQWDETIYTGYRRPNQALRAVLYPNRSALYRGLEQG